MGNTEMQSKVISALASVFLSLTLVFFGYAACAGIPFIAEKAAYATVDADGSPFNKEQLVDAALAIRDYSFGNHDADAMYEEIRAINEQAETPYAEASAAEMATADEAYSITQEQLAHLDDVHDVSSSLMLPALSMALMAAFLLMAALRMFGSKVAITSLKWSGAMTLALVVAAVCIAAFSFDAFFSAFHSMLFADGTWTFSADSLMISALPEGFWVAMGAIWACVTAMLGAASLIIGMVKSRTAAKAAEVAHAASVEKVQQG